MKKVSIFISLICFVLLFILFLVGKIIKDKSSFSYPPMAIYQKAPKKERVLTEKYVLTHYKPLEFRMAVIQKNQRSNSFDVGWGQEMWLVTIPATNISLEVRMAKTREKLNYSISKTLTVNQFNKLDDDLDFKVFDFAISPKSGFKKIKIKLFLKKRT